jgi:hypothetical protein
MYTGKKVFHSFAWQKEAGNTRLNPLRLNLLLKEFKLEKRNY